MQALTHGVATLMRGRPGGGAAGRRATVLLACRQWDPRELARRLPSRGAGAWRGAPLLPWRVQCPGRVCAALVAGSGGLGLVPGVASSPSPPSRPAFPALCVAGRPVRVSLILACWYAIPCGLCVPRARSGCPSGIPRGSFVCVCARALAASAPLPPLPGLVWRAHLARSRCWALVGPFHAVRAPPHVLPRSRSRFGLLGGGGRPRPVSPLPGLGLRAPCGVGPRVWGVPTPGGGGRGAACAPSSPVVWPGGAVGRGVVLPRSVPLPSLGRQRRGCLWRRSGHGGCGPHTAPVRACLLSLGAVSVASLCAGAGSLVHRGSRGSRRLGAWRRALLRPPPPGAAVLPGGGGTVPSASGGWGGGAPVAGGSVGGSGGTGGGVAPSDPGQAPLKTILLMLRLT